MDSRTAELLSKLMLEDDQEDVVFFAFPNEKRKVKCSIAVLMEISPVFEAMFSKCCGQDQTDDVGATKPDSVDPAPQYRTVKLNDDVNFDPYLTFKLLMEIVYGLRHMDSLTVDEATSIFFYAHKYEMRDAVNDIKILLNKRMESGMSTHPLTLVELHESIEFAQRYHLDEFKRKLDQVKLNFDDENAFQFWDLTSHYKMKTLQQQIIDHMMNVVPTNEWPVDLLLAVIGRLQTFREITKKVVEGARCPCNSFYHLYCIGCTKFSSSTLALYQALFDLTRGR